jgi:hypothetical protein
LHDSGKSRLWNPLTKIPHWWWFPGASGNEETASAGQRPIVVASRWGEGYVQLAPGGWQAYPLPTGALLRPHLVELDYPADLPQGLNIRVIEPGASGAVTPFGPASGLDIAGGEGQVSGRVIGIGWYSGPRRKRRCCWSPTAGRTFQRCSVESGLFGAASVAVCRSRSA